MEPNGVTGLLPGHSAYEIFDPMDWAAIEFKDYISGKNTRPGRGGIAPDLDDEHTAIRQTENMALSFGQF